MASFSQREVLTISMYIFDNKDLAKGKCFVFKIKLQLVGLVRFRFLFKVWITGAGVWCSIGMLFGMTTSRARMLESKSQFCIHFQLPAGVHLRRHQMLTWVPGSLPSLKKNQSGVQCPGFGLQWGEFGDIWKVSQQIKDLTHSLSFK